MPANPNQLLHVVGRSGLKMQGFFVGAASSLAPALDAITARLEKIDLAGQGAKFGKSITTA